MGVSEDSPKELRRLSTVYRSLPITVRQLSACPEAPVGVLERYLQVSGVQLPQLFTVALTHQISPNVTSFVCFGTPLQGIKNWTTWAHQLPKTKFIHRPVQRGEAKNVSYFPVPVRGTVSGRDIPATVTLTSPDLSPTPWGANLTPMVQLVPGANWLPEIGQVPLES